MFWLSICSPHVAVRLTSPKSVGLWNSVTILEFTILEIEFSQAMFVLRFIVAIISITIFTFHVYYCCCTVQVNTVPKSSPYLQVKLDHRYRICKYSTTPVIRHWTWKLFSRSFLTSFLLRFRSDYVLRVLWRGYYWHRERKRGSRNLEWSLQVSLDDD